MSDEYVVDKLDLEIATLRGRLSGLEQARAFIVEHSVDQGYGRRLPDPKKSPAWAFILTELESAPPAGISVRNMEERLDKASLVMARNTLLANLSVASRVGMVERVRVGYYRRRSPSLGELMMPIEQPSAIAGA